MVITREAREHLLAVTRPALLLAPRGFIGDGQGWFEAVVTEDRGEDLLVLRWRDWPDTEPFPRRREHLALLPAALLPAAVVQA